MASSGRGTLHEVSIEAVQSPIMSKPFDGLLMLFRLLLMSRPRPSLPALQTRIVDLLDWELKFSNS